MKGRASTRPGSLLKCQIPVRTFADWSEAAPGFLEIDLVSHEGGDPRGEFAYSLCCVDVASGSFEPRVVRNRASRWTAEALVDVRARLPLALLGLDSDNGGEFINNILARWCATERIALHPRPPALPLKRQLPRRAEELWSVVRREVGYEGYDTQAERDLIAEIYADLRLYVNFFLPSTKLIAKERRGARVRKRYDWPQTPYRRLLALGVLPDEKQVELKRLYLRAQPGRAAPPAERQGEKADATLWCQGRAAQKGGGGQRLLSTFCLRRRLSPSSTFLDEASRRSLARHRPPRPTTHARRGTPPPLSSPGAALLIGALQGAVERRPRPAAPRPGPGGRAPARRHRRLVQATAA